MEILVVIAGVCSCCASGVLLCEMIRAFKLGGVDGFLFGLVFLIFSVGSMMYGQVVLHNPQAVLMLLWH